MEASPTDRVFFATGSHPAFRCYLLSSSKHSAGPARGSSVKWRTVTGHRPRPLRPQPLTTVRVPMAPTASPTSNHHSEAAMHQGDEEEEVLIEAATTSPPQQPMATAHRLRRTDHRAMPHTRDLNHHRPHTQLLSSSSGIPSTLNSTHNNQAHTLPCLPKTITPTSHRRSTGMRSLSPTANRPMLPPPLHITVLSTQRLDHSLDLPLTSGAVIPSLQIRHRTAAVVEAAAGGDTTIAVDTRDSRWDPRSGWASITVPSRYLLLQ